jgi:hypothetical protein
LEQGTVARGDVAPENEAPGVVLAAGHPLEQRSVRASARRWISEHANVAQSLAVVIGTAATGAVIDGSLPSIT